MMLRTALPLMLLCLPGVAGTGSGFLQPDAMDRYISGAAHKAEDEAFSFSNKIKDFMGDAANDDAPKKVEEKKPEESALDRAFKAMDDVGMPSSSAQTSSSSDSSSASSPSDSNGFNFRDAIDKVATDAGAAFGFHNKKDSQEDQQQQQDTQQSDSSGSGSSGDSAAPAEGMEMPRAEDVKPAQATGQVFDVHLDSELQESLMQKGKKAKKNAPGVEEAVAKEKAFDVYIHDGFADQEKKDVKEVKEVKADKNLKAAA